MARGPRDRFGMPAVPTSRGSAGSDAPLFAGPIYGLRAWAIHWRGGDAYLGGPIQGTGWRAGGKATEARCSNSRLPRHRAPAPECGCGLYAYHPDKESCRALHWPDDDGPLGAVVGVVEAWGRVELHADGFRAQKARPVAIARTGAPPGSDRARILEQIAARYGAELVDAERPADLIALCRERNWGIDRRVVDAHLDEEDEEEGDPRGARGRSFSSLKEVLGALLAVAGAGLGIYLVIGIALAVLLGFASDEPASPFSARNLEILREDVVRWPGEGPAYAAVVENTSTERVAVAAFPRGVLATRDGRVVARVRDRSTALRPTLLPGERGLVAVPLRVARPGSLDDVASYEVRVVARRKSSKEDASAPRVGPASFDPQRCRIRASLAGGRRAKRIELAFVLRTRGDEMGYVALSREPLRGAGKRIAVRVRPAVCRLRPWVGAELYPHLLPGQVAR